MEEKKTIYQPDSGLFMSSVKVGPKGQIVIPKEVRDMFNIAPGDTLVLLADKQRGIAIQRREFLTKIAEQAFSEILEPSQNDAAITGKEEKE